MLVEALDVRDQGVADHRTTRPRGRTGLHRVQGHDHVLGVDQILGPGLGADRGVVPIRSEQFFEHRTENE